MILSIISASLPTATSSSVSDATPTSTATSAPNSGAGTINSEAFTSTSNTTNTTTNNGAMNALSMFLFWFFLVSTAVLVVGSVVVLRRIRLREQARRAAEQSKKGDVESASASETARAKEIDEESTIGGSVISLPVLPTLTGTTRVGSA